MKTKIINKSKHNLPSYSTDASAGMDLQTNIDENIVLKPMQRTMVPSGLFMEIPVGFEAQIRPGSSHAINKGITVLNSSVTIDFDYRNEICIILINLSDQKFVIKDGERVCQMIVAKHNKAELIMVETIEETGRGNGSFRHTEKK